MPAGWVRNSLRSNTGSGLRQGPCPGLDSQIVAWREVASRGAENSTRRSGHFASGCEGAGAEAYDELTEGGENAFIALA